MTMQTTINFFKKATLTSLFTTHIPNSNKKNNTKTLRPTST